MGDLQELEGFDPNSSLALDESIRLSTSETFFKEDPFASNEL